MRLFLAAELPEAVRARLRVVRDDLGQAMRGWRWVRPEGIHLTLRFLGEVDEARDRAARPVWREAVGRARPLHLRLTRPGCFPERGAPRVLWMGVEETEPGGVLAGLAESLENAARELGWPAERRGFHPHLTLARRGRSGRPDAPPSSWSATGAAGWVREVVLFRSRLSSHGASYTALDSFPLGPGSPAARTRRT